MRRNWKRWRQTFAIRRRFWMHSALVGFGSLVIEALVFSACLLAMLACIELFDFDLGLLGTLSLIAPMGVFALAHYFHGQEKVCRDWVRRYRLNVSDRLLVIPYLNHFLVSRRLGCLGPWQNPDR